MYRRRIIIMTMKEHEQHKEKSIRSIGRKMSMRMELTCPLAMGSVLPLSQLRLRLSRLT